MSFLKSNRWKDTDQVYVRNISWFTVIISDSVLQWKPIFLSALKWLFTKFMSVKMTKQHIFIIENNLQKVGHPWYKIYLSGVSFHCYRTSVNVEAWPHGIYIFFFINWTLRMSDNFPERVQILCHAISFALLYWNTELSAVKYFAICS